MSTFNFLQTKQVRDIANEFGSPCYVYDHKTLEARAGEVLAFPNAFGLTARYAVKACPNASVLRLFDSLGLQFDISSGYEAARALHAGIAPEKLSVSSQELPHNLKELIEAGVLFNATSLQQLRSYGEIFPNTALGLRINPGLGSGGTNRTNVGGPGSSFGLWHECTDQAKAICEEFGLIIERIHTHIGSGSDPKVWQEVSGLSLNMVKQFPAVHTLNLGGGFKVGRMPEEVSTDLQEVGQPVIEAFKNFAEETGRELQLEIEPGTYLVANAGALISRVQDMVTTGPEGYNFMRLDTGMTDILRPSLYGAQHPIAVAPAIDRDDSETEEYMIVGHCCESGDILTPAPGDPEGLLPRILTKAEIGDYVVIDGAGAYCSSMPAKNYNSFPEIPEVLLESDGSTRLVRKRQTLEQVLQNEI